MGGTGRDGSRFAVEPGRQGGRASESTAEAVVRESLGAVGTPSARFSKTMGQKRILVVDDEDVLRELLADILAREGHQVDTACDDLEALDWLDQHHYDAVFTDLHMPGLDGPKLYEAIQKRQGEDLPRVIFMTG